MDVMCTSYVNSNDDPVRTSMGLVVPCLTSRDLVPGEVDVVQAVFDGLSETSRFRRFHASMPRLPLSMARQLASTDGASHVARVVETPGSARIPVGIGRYVVTGPGKAEVALEVIDAWHGRGVGRRLLGQLRERALLAGLTHFEGVAHAENRPILSLLHNELTISRWDIADGVVTFEADLGRPSRIGSMAQEREHLWGLSSSRTA